MKILAVAGSLHMETFEAGTVGRTIEEKGGELVWAIRRHGHILPESHDDLDGLLIFGGEMSVNDVEWAGYFDEVRRVILEFDGAGKPILGICLGAQMIADAFGAKIRRAPAYECGFTELRHAGDLGDDALMVGTPSRISLFEMHEDTFDLPERATHLLTGDAVANQAVRPKKLRLRVIVYRYAANVMYTNAVDRG